MNPNYVTYSLMLICGIFAFTIWKVRQENGTLTLALSTASEELNIRQNKNGECESSLQSQIEATKEVQEILDASLKENEDVKSDLDLCLGALEQLKEQRKKEEEERKKAEEEERIRQGEEQKKLEEERKKAEEEKEEDEEAEEAEEKKDSVKKKSIKKKNVRVHFSHRLKQQKRFKKSWMLVSKKMRM